MIDQMILANEMIINSHLISRDQSQCLNPHKNLILPIDTHSCSIMLQKKNKIGQLEFDNIVGRGSDGDLIFEKIQIN